jgi:membrane protein DedA with SNARE-associated domain
MWAWRGIRGGKRGIAKIVVWLDCGMHELLQVLRTQAYLVLFVSVFFDQGAISVPSQPALIGMGVLIAAGSHSLLMALPVAMAAAFLADFAWYGVGRSYGLKAVRRLERARPRWAVHLTRAEAFVVRREWTSFLVSKFAPGPSFVAPLLAGSGRLPLWGFVLADSVVCAAWSFAYIAAGYLGAHSSGWF